MHRGLERVMGLGAVAVVALAVLLGTASARGDSATGSAGGDAGLSISARARGMAVVARVRWTSGGGDPETFDLRYPASFWEAGASDVVAMSRALLERFGTAVGDRELERELGRMRNRSQDPRALADLLQALGGDPVKVKECLVRPVLVRRLLRHSVAWDPELQAAARWEAARLSQAEDAAELEGIGGSRAHRRTVWREGAPGIPPARDGGRERVIDAQGFGRLAARLGPRGRVSAPVEDGEALVVEAALDIGDDRIDTVTVAVPKQRIELWWREVSKQYRGPLPADLMAAVSGDVRLSDPRLTMHAEPGSDAAPAGDSWTVQHGVLAARAGHTAVWTGRDMIVWGGSPELTVGGLYDPATDSWSFTTTVGAPAPRSGHTAVWTGTEMIIWGGTNDRRTVTGCDPYCRHESYLRSGARYDPVADRWRDLPVTHGPTATHGHTAVWTGSEMIVWGGSADGRSATNLGFAYDPASDRWRAIRYLSGAPSARMYHSVVWTGTEMVVWGGRQPYYNTVYDDGARYDPAGDSWQPLETAGAVPGARWHHAAVWTGSEMIVVGGRDAQGFELQDGARWSPARHRWFPVPSSWWVGREAVWTGTELVAWGGADWAEPGGAGARFDPGANTWTPMSLEGCPVERAAFSMLWAGERVLVWGGRGTNGEALNSGGTYRPETDSWSATGTGDEPANRIDHTAVWTGSEMVIWGGSASRPLADGARYDPATSTWAPLSSIGECAPRSQHSAVWNGSEMIVWGGRDDGGAFDDGCTYDPVSDTWRAMSASGAPSPRRWHGAVWTGEEMLVWGGSTVDSSGGATALGDGGIYRVGDDSWQPIVDGGIPGARAQPQTFWTGEELAVLGGPADGWAVSSVALFRPSDHSWREPTSEGMPVTLRNTLAEWTPRGLLISTPQMWGTSATGAALYVPESDRWIRLQDLDQAGCVAGCRAVWTGRELLVWGGTDLGRHVLSGGYRFDMATGRWREMATENGPGARLGYSAVWTGSAMLLWGGEIGGGLAVYRPGPPSVRRAPSDGRLGHE